MSESDDLSDLTPEGIKRLISKSGDMLDEWHAERGLTTERMEMKAHIATLLEALSTAERRGAERMRERCAHHLSEVAQAMWDRCETKRSATVDVADGEKEDATTAWCFDKAAEAIRNLEVE